MTRKKAREQAFLIIFQTIFFKDLDMYKLFERNLEDGHIKENEFTYTLCEIVFTNISEINEIIKNNSISWELSRISSASLAALKLAIAEIKYIENIPFKVSINEAIELMKKFADEQDALFVNGVLSGVVNGKKETMTKCADF